MPNELIDRESLLIPVAPPPPLPVARIQLTRVANYDDTAIEGEFSDVVRTQASRRYTRLAFFVLFILPVSIATIYFGLIASNIYVSETKFIVRTAAHGDGGLASIVGDEGLGRAVDETYAVTEYMGSRDVAALLKRDDKLAEVMSRPSIDLLTRYPNFYSKNDSEQFYKAFKRMIDIYVDNTTGITTLEVRASDADDAHSIAAALINKGEEFVNTLNVRAQQDEMQFAETLVKDAEARLADVEKRLAAYRNKELLLDPEGEAKQSFIILGNLTTEISQLEASLAQQIAMTPDNPAIEPLRERIKAYRAELKKYQLTMAGGQDSIAGKLQNFELLSLERELVSKEVATAAQELLKARKDAQTQRIYLQPIVEPGVPDQPLLPHRLMWIGIVALASFAVYRIVRSFVDTTMEHI